MSVTFLVDRRARGEETEEKQKVNRVMKETEVDKEEEERNAEGRGENVKTNEVKNSGWGREYRLKGEIRSGR